MTPTAAPAIQARRRPGAILLLWAVRLVGAWLVATPVANVVGAGLGHLPRGDAVLFDPGGEYLLEVARLRESQLLATASTAAWGLVVVGALCLLPLCALVVALAQGGRLRPSHWFAHTARHLPPYALLAGLTALVQVVGAGVVALCALGSRDSLILHLGQPSADLAVLTLLALGVAWVLGIGVVQDLARAAVVRCDVGVTAALRVAARVTACHPLRVAVDWLTPAVWALAVVVAAAVVVRGLHVEADGEWRVAAALVTHQLAALALVGLRAAWLARALGHVPLPSAAEPDPTIELDEASLASWPPDDRPPGSAAPVDPIPDRDASRDAADS